LGKKKRRRGDGPSRSRRLWRRITITIITTLTTFEQNLVLRGAACWEIACLRAGF
jgi:hypothetical protein